VQTDRGHASPAADGLRPRDPPAEDRAAAIPGCDGRPRDHARMTISRIRLPLWKGSA
jgi:hypothetical protein